MKEFFCDFCKEENTHSINEIKKFKECNGCGLITDQNLKDKFYLVQYSNGSYDDYYKVNIFVTFSKESADKYVEKFNRRLDHWKEYMKSFEDKYGYRDDKKCVTKISYRYYDVMDMNYAFIDEIELR